MDEQEYIPINKGHHNFESEERLSEFSNKLAVGWEEEYKAYRSDWGNLPKTKKVRDYPLLVDLELSSLCNLKCPMCYTVTDEFKSQVTKGFMDFDLAKKIIDEIAGKVPALRVSLRGEPTLNKNYLKIVKYAKSKGIKEVSSLTNGSKFRKPEFLKGFVDSGIDWVSISIDGMSDSYDIIRKPLKFEGMMKTLNELKEYKKEIGTEKPVVKVQAIWPSIKKYPQKFYDTLKPVSDLIAYNPLIDYLSNDNTIVYEENFSCPQLYQRVTIDSTGSVMMCANDEDGVSKVGDANTQTIHEIWHGKAFNDIRDIHKKKDGFKEINICKNCYYPRKTENSETSSVNGTEIVVENYINRPQEVGE